MEKMNNTIKSRSDDSRFYLRAVVIVRSIMTIQQKGLHKGAGLMLKV